MFLSSPSLKDLDALVFSGLFIDDLSMHDFSRDLLLASEPRVIFLPQDSGESNNGIFWYSNGIIVSNEKSLRGR